MKSPYTIPLAIIFGGIVIALAVYYSRPKTPPPATTVNPSLLRPVSAADHIFGNPTAPVVIVEYCDFDSTFCKGFQDTLAEIIANEGATGQVAWVYREFPLTEIHPDSPALAQAAECAGQVGGTDAASNNDAFWRFANALYDNQPVDPSILSTVADDAGISGSAFASCYATASSTVGARITADRQNALEMHAIGVPFSVLLTDGGNPVVIDSAYPYSAVKDLVDQALLSAQ